MSVGLKTLNVGADAANVLERPDSRLRLAALLAAFPLLLVFARILQVTSTEQFVFAGNGVLRSVLEPIPARNGRILSADGRVLAEDVESFSLLVNYRWFEEPPNARWLRGEALRRLSRSERRQPEAVFTAERQVLEQRNALWEELSRLSGLDAQELRKRFQEHQAKVVRLISDVEKQRAEQTKHDAPRQAIAASTWWEAAYRNLREALTTSPRPRSEEPLVLAEEQRDYEIASGLPLAVAAQIESDPERCPGTQVRLTSQRHYPFESTAAHLIGYRFGNDVSERDSQSQAGGQTGIERSYERHLQGVDGVRRIWTNRRGEAVREVVLQEPRIGRDVVLNVDLGLQQELEALLDRAVASAHDGSETVPASAGGCIVALDARTGAILASASAPRFDLQSASMRDPAFWKAIASAETRPMFDRATSAALPPGSVFKAVTAAALLDSRRINPDEPFECAGYLNRKDRHRDYIFRHFGVGHGPTTMNSALAQSCNVYFFHTAKILGAEPIISWAERFGFGRPTGIDLPSETAGHVPMNSRSADSLGIAIGQADLTASPLQVVRAMAAIANGGRLVTPHVVRGSGPQAGGSSVRPLLRSDPVPRLTSDMLVRLREALEQVVSHPLGSGYKSVRHPKIAIAGKTGTAEVGGDLPDHAWFAGYAPADDPMVAFVVLLENAGSGGQSAGPVARQTVETLDRLGFLNDSP